MENGVGYCLGTHCFFYSDSECPSVSKKLTISCFIIIFHKTLEVLEKQIDKESPKEKLHFQISRKTL